MSDPVDFVDNSIGQLLVALADGVREAERALSSGPSVDESGRAVTRYALPYLDFTISVDVEVATTPSAGGVRGLPVLRLYTAPASENRQIRSSVSGRLVAVPAGDGLPAPRIRLTPGPNIGGKASIALLVTNSAGEVLARQPVELNLDQKTSETLSKARGVASLPRRDGTRLADGVVVTGADGRAATQLLIDAGEPARALLVVTASVGSFSAQVSISAEVVG